MKFQELREYYEAEEDHFSIAKLDNTRRARLTLKHLNKLRKKRGLERKERLERAETLSTIYGGEQGGEAPPEL